MWRNKVILWGTIIITLVAAVASFLVPVPNTYPLSDIEFYLPFISNVIMAALHLGAAILITTNLDVYKAKLRQAYTMIAIGAIITGLGTLQLSVIAVLDAWRSAYVLGGGMMLPFLIASFIFYFSMRQFTILIGTRHTLAHAWISIPVSLAIAAASSFLPHVPVTLRETSYDIGIAVIAWSAALLYFSGFLALAIRKNAGTLYARPMGWLAGALFVSGLCFILQDVYALITTDYDHIVTRINNVAVIISGLMWLRAAYAFALTKYYQADVPMLRMLFSRSDAVIKQQTTIIDMVTNAASLASNSSEIDPLLDSVRAITVKLQPGEQPSASDSFTLISVYLKIEQYLLTKEPVRKFTKQELRAQLAPSIQKIIISYESR